MNLHWKQVGNPHSEQTIIFLHEGLGCVEMWRDYPDFICESLNVRGIVYDRAGYGKSEGSLLKRTSVYLHEAAEELKGLMVHLNIDKPILYGHSDGGSIALIFAAKYPTDVQAVITEAAHVFNEAETIQGVREARPLLEQGAMDGLKKYHGERYKEVFYAWNDIWLDESFIDWNAGDIKSIEVQQLIIQGEDDQYGTLKQLECIEKETTGETKLLVLNNCGHAPFKEQREKVATAVINFINGIH